LAGRGSDRSCELLVAASNSADTSIIPLDGHSAAVAATPIPSVVVAVASMIPVVGPTDINSEVTSFKVHALSESRRRSGHGIQQSEGSKRFRNPSHQISFLSVPPLPLRVKTVCSRRSFQWNLLYWGAPNAAKNKEAAD